MQTPGLPASQPPSANRSATNSVLEKRSRAGEHFGEVMHRALNSHDSDEPGNQHTTAQPHHSHRTHDLAAKSTDTSDKTDSTEKKLAVTGSVTNFILEKPAHRGKHFSEVMHRASTASEFDEHLNQSAAAVRPQPFSLLGDLTAKNNNTPGEAGAPSNDTNKKQSASSSKSENSQATIPLAAITMAPTPVPSSTPKQSAPTFTELSKAAPAPVSAEAANTVVTDAKPADTEPTNANDPATTETAATPLDSKLSQTTTSPDDAQKTPPAATKEELPAAVETVAPPSDEAKTASQGEPDPQPVQIVPVQTGHKPIVTSPADPHGTSAAKQDMTMKKVDKTQKVAGLTEQDLPGNTATGSEELPEGQKISAKTAMHGEKPEATAIELPTRISTSVASPAPTVTAAAPAPAPAIDSRVLERTHDIVALHAMRLTDTGADSLRVVVKPGGGIQLSLELRQSARGIEVSAELHKGDFQHLNQHWSDLQQRLEARGVRVSSLTTAENYTGGQHFNQSKQQSSNQDPLYAGAFAEFALAGSMTEAPGARAARATAYRGWETWA